MSDIFYVLFVANHGYYCGIGPEGPVYCKEPDGTQEVYSCDCRAWRAAEMLQHRVLEDGDEELLVKIERKS